MVGGDDFALWRDGIQMLGTRLHSGGRMDGWMDRGIDEGSFGWVDERMCGLEGGWVDRWRVVWMSG